MKNMELAYTRKAVQALGLTGEETSVRKLPDDRSGFLFSEDGQLSSRALPLEGQSVKMADAVLPAAWEMLRTLCASKAQEKDSLLWVMFREPREVLARLTGSETIKGDLAERLERFLSLRPCFYPALRPALGALLDRENGRLFPTAVFLKGYGSAEEGFAFPLAMNLELTTQCPLRCPQCYVHLQAGRHMPKEIALQRIDQAGELGVVTVNLSGGETMCYPWLFDVIRRARDNDIEPDVALSGFGINDRTLGQLLDAGVNGIYVSLNGPTEAINSHTRDGYGLAVTLLELLRERGFDNTYINWVVHDSNADLLPEMLQLGEKYGIHGLMVMAFKPDSQNALPSLPSADQMKRLADQIRSYDGPLDLNIESCYSSLRALTGKSFFGNSNRGPFMGCGAGRDSFSVAMDGRLSPCRHIELYEEWDHISEYWEKSPVLKQIRQAQRNPAEPCRSCRFSDACRHCMAVNLKLHGILSRGDATCPLAEGGK